MLASHFATIRLVHIACVALSGGLFPLSRPAAYRRGSRRQPLAASPHILRDRHNAVGRGHPADFDPAPVSIHRRMADHKVTSADTLYFPRNIRSQARPSASRPERRPAVCAPDIRVHCRCCNHSPASWLAAADSAVDGCGFLACRQPNNPTSGTRGHLKSDRRFDVSIPLDEPASQDHGRVSTALTVQSHSCDTRRMTMIIELGTASEQTKGTPGGALEFHTSPVKKEPH